MLDKLIGAALFQPRVARDLIREELARLERGGYLDTDEVAGLLEGTLAALEERLGRAGSAVVPALFEAGSGLGSTVGRTLREALDLPSQEQVVALTEALRARDAKDAAGAPGPAAEPVSEQVARATADGTAGGAPSAGGGVGTSAEDRAEGPSSDGRAGDPAP